MKEITALRVLAEDRFGGMSACARAIGVHDATIYRANRRHPVSADTRKRIEEAFGGKLTLEDLQKPIAAALFDALGKAAS